ncbi:MAG: hypothetical protein ABGY43_16475 [bacterium]|jgi:hypothetical protein|nr:hypothetical protein [Gammaproteobacteria bacterium]
MKVFVPMSDAVLGDNGEVCQSLIPFDLSFLGSTQEPDEGKKPSNWVSDYDREQARQRLFAAQG